MNIIERGFATYASTVWLWKKSKLSFKLLILCHVATKRRDESNLKSSRFPFQSETHNNFIDFSICFQPFLEESAFCWASLKLSKIDQSTNLLTKQSLASSVSISYLKKWMINGNSDTFWLIKYLTMKLMRQIYFQAVACQTSLNHLLSVVRLLDRHSSGMII